MKTTSNTTTAHTVTTVGRRAVWRNRAKTAYALAWLGAAYCGQASASPSTEMSKVGSELSVAITGVSTLVVTAAIVWSGYQIAFNNKRFGDVFPILFGGVIVGMAGTLVSFFSGLTTTG